MRFPCYVAAIGAMGMLAACGSTDATPPPAASSTDVLPCPAVPMPSDLGREVPVGLVESVDEILARDPYAAGMYWRDGVLVALFSQPDTARDELFVPFGDWVSVEYARYSQVELDPIAIDLTAALRTADPPRDDRAPRANYDVTVNKIRIFLIDTARAAELLEPVVTPPLDRYCLDPIGAQQVNLTAATTSPPGT